MMTAELIDSQLALNFLKCPGRIKTNFIARRQFPSCNFIFKSYCGTKSLASIGERSPNQVWCAECFWRARRSLSKSLRGGRGGQTVEWLYGCRRVMKTPRPDQEDLIRLTRRRDSSMMRRIRVMKTPQSPRDLIRRTWIRGIPKNSRRRRGLRCL